jgi:hypothetical protein
MEANLAPSETQVDHLLRWDELPTRRAPSLADGTASASRVAQLMVDEVAD